MVFKTLCIFGTRPEAIKMAPVVRCLSTVDSIENKVCVTGQHSQMLDSVLNHFAIKPDFKLNVMVPSQELSALTASILTKLADVFKSYQPDLVLVHGDTTTTLTASLSAAYHHVAVAHVEAGLRTGNNESPWPEEINRKLTAGLARLHFAPTQIAKQNLLREGIASETIYVTGNTVIDALHETVRRLATEPALTVQLQQQFHYLNPLRKLILITGHRRESFGKGFERICQAIAKIAQQNPDIDLVYPVHLNPQVQQPVQSLLGGITNIFLIDPIDYLPFVYLMQSAYLILTDSGGIQEEAPSLGKPVLVMRDISERPEAVTAGCVKLVGTEVSTLVNTTQMLITDKALYHSMSTVQNPYGDGKAATRIVNTILEKYVISAAIF